MKVPKALRRACDFCLDHLPWVVAALFILLPIVSIKLGCLLPWAKTELYYEIFAGALEDYSAEIEEATGRVLLNFGEAGLSEAEKENVIRRMQKKFPQWEIAQGGGFGLADNELYMDFSFGGLFDNFLGGRLWIKSADPNKPAGLFAVPVSVSIQGGPWKSKLYYYTCLPVSGWQRLISAPAYNIS